jgi:hypothetical protein
MEACRLGLPVVGQLAGASEEALEGVGVDVVVR